MKKDNPRNKNKLGHDTGSVSDPFDNPVTYGHKQDICKDPVVALVIFRAKCQYEEEELKIVQTAQVKQLEKLIQ